MPGAVDVAGWRFSPFSSRQDATGGAPHQRRRLSGARQPGLGPAQIQTSAVGSNWVHAPCSDLPYGAFHWDSRLKERDCAGRAGHDGTIKHTRKGRRAAQPSRYARVAQLKLFCCTTGP